MDALKAGAICRRALSHRPTSNANGVDPSLRWRKLNRACPRGAMRAATRASCERETRFIESPTPPTCQTNHNVRPRTLMRGGDQRSDACRDSKYAFAHGVGDGSMLMVAGAQTMRRHWPRCRCQCQHRDVRRRDSIDRDAPLKRHALVARRKLRQLLVRVAARRVTRSASVSTRHADDVEAGIDVDDFAGR